MDPEPQNLSDSTASDTESSEDPFTMGDALLNRAKDVARRIAERVRRLTGDTQTEHPPLPTDPTEEQPPLP
jgi:hypothetical protein